MADGSITIVARIRARPGQRERLKAELYKLLEPTRGEQGCINDEMHQGVDNPDLFLFYETWATEEVWRTHLPSPHIQAYAILQEELLAQPSEVTFWKRVE
jgi:quinol monooxygenase YgiN